MVKNNFSTKTWFGVSLVNFCVVALAGVTLRYKINFALPGINQKHLLYAHSNLGFLAWVSVALMTMMIRYLILHSVQTGFRKYNALLGLTVFTAYAMFVAFLVQGYGFWSILFTAISIFLSFFFIFFYWRDLKQVTEGGYSKNWIKAGLLLWAFSSLGAFMLAYLMANHIMIQDLYFASSYFFLHFQYNGWFLFICFGALFSYLHRHGLERIAYLSKRLFFIMIVTVIPTYFLSILWLRLPAALYWTASISAVLQLLVLVYFFQMLILIRKTKTILILGTTRWLWIMAASAFAFKILLQALSVLPFFSQFAFGFRPVVIGYLHLSFIGIISLFIFGYVNEFIHRFRGRISGIGAILFVAGFLIQEIILLFQGLEGLIVEPVKNAPILLFYCAILMAVGLLWTTIGFLLSPAKENEEQHHAIKLE